MTQHADDWPDNLPAGQHIAAPRRIGWRKAITGLTLAGVTLCLVGAALTPLLKPTTPPRLEAVTMAAPVAPPAPTLEPDEVKITRVTEPIHASQPGDSLPISYRTPRIMQAGQVLIQLTGVRVSGEEVEQGKQVFRFELVDALTGEVIGTADVTREEGVDGEPVTLATLTEPRATYLRVSAEVRGESTCHGCEPGGYSYDRPTWHSWSALLRYDKEGD